MSRECIEELSEHDFEGSVTALIAHLQEIVQIHGPDVQIDVADGQVYGFGGWTDKTCKVFRVMV